MKEIINWRQLYNESQAIRPEDTSVSTERIARLINIYKNDLIEQDLHRYAQRLTTFFRCCQTCSPKSYTIYRWVDTYISGEKNLFDFRLSGRSVSALVYYWKKTLVKQYLERGQLSDFQMTNHETFSISNLSNIDENIVTQKHFFTSIIPHWIYQWIIRFQMYYTYRKSQSLSLLSLRVHSQPMKTFRYLFQTNISPIFVCFINDDNDLCQLFWAFRHMITIFNWPLTTKIFANRSFPNNSIFERKMADCLGFIDLSRLNLNQTDVLSYLYRCLKTCDQNGPIIFLFDSSSIFEPTSSDYVLMSFLCDLIRFDLSIPDMLLIPTRLYQSYFSFSQPFLFKELVEFFLKKMHIQKQFCEVIQTEDRNIVYKLIDCLFLHLAFDINQLVLSTMEASHLISAIELCQMPSNQQSPTTETIFNIYQTILKTCPFILTDNYKWNEITAKDIEQYQFKFELISMIRKEYFLEILAGNTIFHKIHVVDYLQKALSILSKIQHLGNTSRVFEYDMFNQMVFLLFTFGTKKYLHIRPCQTVHRIVQQTIQHCQSRNYIPIDTIPQKSMHFRDTIHSDHEWSEDDDEDDDNDMQGEFIDHQDDIDDDDFMMGDILHKNSHSIKPIYRINYQENQFQLKFFAKLFGPQIEAIVFLLKQHVEKQLQVFTLDELDSDQIFHFKETSSFISNDTLLSIRRAYTYRLLEHENVSDEILMFFEPMNDSVCPLSMEKLVSLCDEFVKLLNCCFD